MADYHSGASNNHVAASETQSAIPPAHTVGLEFTRQFYHVLTAMPNLAFRFYTDSSTLTHSGNSEEAVTVYGQNAINDKIRSLNLFDARAQVNSVDAQYSHSGGVTVLVTGEMHTTGQGQRNFVQSFFLATQEKGYFVLNDTFRYLPDSSKPSSADSATSDLATNGNAQSYAIQHEANGYGNIGRASSAGAQHKSTPSPPQPPVSAFQQANGHLSGHLSSELGAGQASGDLKHSPSPSKSQVLPPPPPRPTAAPTPTPPQQTPPVPPPQQSTEPEHAAQQQQSQQQQPAAPKEAGDDHPVSQPAVDQNRAPVRSGRKPSTTTPEADSSEASAAASTAPKTQMSYADLLRQKDSSNTQPVNRPSTPSQSSPATGASAQPSAPSAPSATAALPQRPSGSRQQNRVPAASAGSASSDQSAKENQPANQAQERPSGGPSNRSSYSNSQAQGYGADDSNKKAVFVTNIPEEATSDELREVFGQFGIVKSGSGSVTLKKSGGKAPFAYVDFVDAASAQAAVEASTVQLRDVELKIQAKRPQNIFAGGRGRGGYNNSRGGNASGGYSRGGRGDRGSFSGGRGPGPFPGAEGQIDGAADRAQGNRPAGRGGQAGPRGRGGRDGGRGRGRGPPRQPSVQGNEIPASASVQAAAE